MQLSERLLTPESERTPDVVSNILRKRDLLLAGDPAHEEIKTALVIGAGAMRGAFSGGVVIGLEELGLTETFDDVVGVSVGASTAAYFLANQSARGTSLFFEELTTKDFVDFRRVRNILNVGFLEDIFTTGGKVLDQEAIRKNRTRLHVGVTNINTAQAEYIDVSDYSDKEMIRVIQASSSVPGLAPPIVINGETYGDGITTCKNPIGFAVEELGATDVLCIINQPLRHETVTSIGERALSALLTRGFSEEIRNAYMTRHYMSDEVATTAYSPNVRIGILCPQEKTVGRLTKDSQKLIQLAQQGTQLTINVFESLSNTATPTNAY